MTQKHEKTSKTPPPKEKKDTLKKAPPKEYGGPKGLEPTRFGDWEKNGRCSDF